VPIEVEKKYRLTLKQKAEILARLPGAGAQRIGEEFEENTLFEGEMIDTERSVLRLRRIDQHGILTHKERLATRSDAKHQQEDETRVDDPEAMASILDAIGFSPALVYEKRRETWVLGATEIVIDELPFGLFMEIEGDEASIHEVETKLAIKGLKTESSTYPQLTRKHGVDEGGVIEARFSDKK
jgi:adenylate cyclase class 2